MQSVQSSFQTVILMFCIAGLSFATLNNAQAKTQNSAAIEQKFEQAIMLNGFAPNTEIFYTVVSRDHFIAEGKTKTDNAGALILKYNEPDAALGDHRIYDFKIKKDGDYTDLLVRHDLKSGKITASGKGLNKFATVAIVAQEKNKTTRADWSGAFQESLNIKDDTTEANNFEIALHGISGLSALADQQNPAIIKVLSAPGGGFFTQTPNQPPTPTPPSSGFYNLSTTFTARVIDTMESMVENHVQAMMLMTDQLSAVMMQQVFAIGQFFDAKMQLEVQRTHQELKAQAVKDYHPSEQMCRIGSSIRSLAKTEQKLEIDKFALNDIMMTRYRNRAFSTSAEDPSNDFDSRLKQFREVYCNVRDNDNGLDFVCEHDQDEQLNASDGQGTNGANSTAGAPVPRGIGGLDPERFNKDIDFTRTMEFPQTLDVDTQDGIEAEDEQDIIALAKNLYWPNTVQYGDKADLPEKHQPFLDMQRIVALKNVAHNSYTNLAALKARSAIHPIEEPEEGQQPGWAFMKTMMRDFGISDEDIEELVGVQPSYWAQMNFLTKQLYQLPHFYTNLYDKPTNVDRIDVTLDAIKLMQMRDYFDSNLRREMLNSALIETELSAGNHYSRVESDLLFSGE